MPGSPKRPDSDREDDQEDRSIRRWLRVADEFVRKKNNVRKGGERVEKGERPENERREA